MNLSDIKEIVKQVNVVMDKLEENIERISSKLVKLTELIEKIERIYEKEGGKDV